MVHLVKRRGHKEKFDERKVYASVYAACMSSHSKEKEAEKTAEVVCKEVKKWLRGKSIVNSRDIFRFVIKEIKKKNKNASFMYETHMDVS